MTSIAIVSARLRGTHVSDVLVGGFRDEDTEPARFRARYRRVYLELDGALLALCTIEDTGRLQLALISSIESDPELDDDMPFALTSVREVVLQDPESDNAVLALRLWGVTLADGGVECAAARFDLANGQQLFVDPTYHFGIRMGGPEQERAWRENLPSPPGEPLTLQLG